MVSSRVDCAYLFAFGVWCAGRFTLFILNTQDSFGQTIFHLRGYNSYNTRMFLYAPDPNTQRLTSFLATF